MENEKFKNLKASLTPSLKTTLNHIKRFLLQGKASVMIGAGFSKNAVTDSSLKMKDWNDLGSDFHKRLYPDEHSGNIFCLNPIRLASQIEALFGRNELDEMILHSLPDERVFPGELHKALLELPWKDVFTTNYDTLLERAMIDAGRYYEVVTNKETLLYKTSPRIIKLHGSFQNVRPFIITEEDYRKYPNTHSEFVNTVKQSLIEGILCLIGFSGNDPNFLEWIGWLRDVMGSQVAPIYLITSDKDLHLSELKLNDSRGINTINLADIENFDDSNERDAFDFLFRYLGESETSNKWNGRISDYKLSTPREIKETIKQMSTIRVSYPGWILLPANYYSNFDDLNREFPFLDNKLSILKEHKQDLLSFIYELDWRLNISLTPKDIDWYYNIIKDITSKYDTDDPIEKEKIISLRVTLLSIYRQRFDVENFNNLSKEIGAFFYNSNNVDKKRYFYENSLFNISIMDYDSVLMGLKEWDVHKSDYIAILWKSCIYGEIGYESKAIAILNESLQNIRKDLLVNNSPFLTSCQSFIENSINIYDYGQRSIRYKQSREEIFDFEKIIKALKQSVEGDKREGMIREHDFNIGKTTTTWHCGPNGFSKTYSYAYRYILAYEKAGHPIGLLDLPIGSDDFKYILSKFLPFNFYFTTAILVRLNTPQVIMDCMSREALKVISCEQANRLFDIFFQDFNEKNKADKKTIIRIGNVILPLFSRLSTILSYDRILKLLIFYVKKYANSEWYYKDELMTIYRCLNEQQLSSVLGVIYSTPINSISDGDDIMLPERGYTLYQIDDTAFHIIEHGLLSENSRISDSAYYRLVNIYKYLSPERKEMLNDAIYKWRANAISSINQRYSFRLLVYNKEKDVQNIYDIVRKDLSILLSQKYTHINSSLPIQELTKNIQTLCAEIEYLSSEDHKCILTYILNFLKTNKEILKENDSNPFFGGLRIVINRFYNSIVKYVTLLSDLNDSITIMQSIDINIINNLINIVKELAEYKLKGLSIITPLFLYSKNVKQKDLILKIENSLFSANPLMQTDAVDALLMLAKHNAKIQKLIKKVIDCIELSQSKYTSRYIDLLIQLVLKNAIGKTALNEIPKLLRKLYSDIQLYPISEEYKTDIYYSANMLAGVISIVISPLTTEMSEAVNEWKEFSDSIYNFNDVKIGFEIGVNLAKSNNL